MKRETDHVVLSEGKCVCLHCGQSYAIGLPCPLRMLVAITNTWLDMHRGCSPRESQPSPEPKDPKS